MKLISWIYLGGLIMLFSLQAVPVYADILSAETGSGIQIGNSITNTKDTHKKNIFLGDDYWGEEIVVTPEEVEINSLVEFNDEDIVQLAIAELAHPDDLELQKTIRDIFSE